MGKREREKGKRGERMWRDEQRAQGYTSHRGVQYSGKAEDGSDPADTVWNIPIHNEVKNCESWKIRDWITQARADAQRAGKPWIIAATRNNASPKWTVMMDSELFFALLRGDYAEASAEAVKNSNPTETASNEISESNL